MTRWGDGLYKREIKLTKVAKDGIRKYKAMQEIKAGKRFGNTSRGLR